MWDGETRLIRSWNAFGPIWERAVAATAGRSVQRLSTAEGSDALHIRVELSRWSVRPL